MKYDSARRLVAPLARTVIQAPYGRFNGSSTLPLLPPASSGPLVPACHVPYESRTATPTLPRSPTQNASTQAAARRTPYETQSSISAWETRDGTGASGTLRRRYEAPAEGDAQRSRSQAWDAICQAITPGSIVCGVQYTQRSRCRKHGGGKYAQRSRSEALCVMHNVPSDHAVGSMW